MSRALEPGNKYRVETISHVYELYFIGFDDLTALFSETVNGEVTFTLEVDELSYLFIHPIEAD